MVTNDESLLIAELGARDGDGWVPADDGISFVRRTPQATPVLSRFARADASVGDILALPPTIDGRGFDLSPDRAHLLFSQVVAQESDLGLAVPR